MLYIKASAAKLAWPVHGSYTGQCGRCMVYTDRLWTGQLADLEISKYPITCIFLF